MNEMANGTLDRLKEFIDADDNESTFPALVKCSAMRVDSCDDAIDEERRRMVVEMVNDMAAIPIDGSQNAISLWEKTGRLLGMSSAIDGLDLSGGSGPTIEYSPTLQFYGGTPNKDDLTNALRVSQDEFDSLMERYIKTHGRLAFG